MKEMICKLYIWQGVISQIYKEFAEFSSKKKEKVTIWLKKWAENLYRHLKYRWPTSTQKDVQHLYEGNENQNYNHISLTPVRMIMLSKR